MEGTQAESKLVPLSEPFSEQLKENPSTKEVLTNKPFMFLFSAQFSQNIASAVSWLALQFLIFGLTGSPGLMGLLSIVFWIPYVVITPFAGVLVDRFDQRKIMLLANILSFLASLGYVFVYLLKDSLTIHIIITEILPSGQKIATHYLNPIHILWPMFVLTFLNSTASAFFFPSRNAYTRLIVQKKNLLIANSIGSTVYQIATIVGYALAGFLASISYLASFIFDASTYAFSITMIIMILVFGKKPPEVIRPKSANFRAEVKGVVDDLKIGYQTIRETPKISYMLILFASAIFSFAAFNVLFVVILQDEMGLNTLWYGGMQAVMGVAGIITAMILMRIGKLDRKILILNISISVLTGVLYFYSFVRNKWMMGVILFILGAALVCVNIPATTLIQESIPYEKQGRVFGTQQLLQGISRLVGMGIVSLIAEIVLPMYIVLASSVLLTIMVIFGFIYSGRKGLMASDYREEEKEPLIIGNEIDKKAEQVPEAIDLGLSFEPKEEAFSGGESSRSSE